MPEQKPSPLANDPESVEDGISRATTLLLFLEETAGNYGTQLGTPACTGENGYSVEGWAGMSLVLAHVRQGLENITANLEGNETRRQA